MAKGMKLDVPTIILAVYVLYAIIDIGMTGLLFSLAIGLILFGVVDSYTTLVAGVVLSGIVWKLFLANLLKAKEGFQSGVTDTAQIISKRIERVQKPQQPTGFLSSSFVEGFADADATNSSKPDAGSEKAKEPMTNASNSSVPASNDAPTTSPELQKSLPKEGYQNKKDGIFKLGQLPAETSGGFHIDAGTTLLNTLNSLKPDQIEAMTNDTKKLMETQKSLMGMLSSMKPMLSEGKQMMETFQEMFGKQ